LDGQQGTDTYVVNIQGGATTGNLINVFDTGMVGATPPTQAFNAAAVNAATDAITVAANAFTTGQAVMYHTNSNTPIPGLVDGQIYFVVAVSSTQIQLAASLRDTGLTTPAVIDLGAATGNGHSLALQDFDTLTVNGT